MYEIVIKLPDKPETIAKLSPGVYRIGKSPASHINLDRPEVSSRHAVIHVNDSSLTITDSGSTNGTFVDNRKIKADKAVEIGHGTVVGIGREIKLQIMDKSQLKKAPEDKDTGGSDASDSSSSQADAGGKAPKKKDDKEGTPLLKLSGIKFEYRKVAREIKLRVHEELIQRVNLKNLTLSGASYGEVEEQAKTTIKTVLEEFRNQIPSGIDVKVLEQELVDAELEL